MPPKSQEFRRIERRILGAAMRDLGFRRPPGVGLSGWLKQEPNGWFVVWTQLSHWNYGDEPEGYRFTLEFQLGTQPIAGTGERRMRFYELLDGKQRLDHLAIHNRVIAKAKPNPLMMSMLSPSEQVRHLDELQPRRELPERWDDPWFVYIDQGDIQAWMEFLAAVMPSLLDRFLASDTPIQTG
jgi:hypothetical protein